MPAPLNPSRLDCPPTMNVLDRGETRQVAEMIEMDSEEEVVIVLLNNKTNLYN